MQQGTGSPVSASSTMTSSGAWLAPAKCRVKSSDEGTADIPTSGCSPNAVNTAAMVKRRVRICCREVKRKARQSSRVSLGLLPRVSTRNHRLTCGSRWGNRVELRQRALAWSAPVSREQIRHGVRVRTGRAVPARFLRSAAIHHRISSPGPRAPTTRQLAARVVCDSDSLPAYPRC